MTDRNKGAKYGHTPGYENWDKDYVAWMENLVCGEYSGGNEWNKLLNTLHGVDFVSILDMDTNRAEDGRELRYRYFRETYPGNPIPYEVMAHPCSVLEMMVALAVRCEEDIMDDPDSGNRTGKWFFDMIKSLKLYSMTDDAYDEALVYERIDIFLKREYASNGRGGLFTVTNARRDMREVEIWYQLMWYLDDVIYGRR